MVMVSKQPPLGAANLRPLGSGIAVETITGTTGGSGVPDVVPVCVGVLLALKGVPVRDIVEVADCARAPRGSTARSASASAANASDAEKPRRTPRLPAPPPPAARGGEEPPQRAVLAVWRGIARLSRSDAGEGKCNESPREQKEKRNFIM